MGINEILVDIGRVSINGRNFLPQPNNLQGLLAIGRSLSDVVQALTTSVVQRRPYRLSQQEQQVVRTKISELPNANVIRPSCSPFDSPIILVEKKNNTTRMCIDFIERLTRTWYRINSLYFLSPSKLKH